MNQATLTRNLRQPDSCGEVGVTLEEGADLVLGFTRILYINGQSTDETLTTARRLGKIVGLRAGIMPRWGELQVQVENADRRVFSVVAADPVSVNMYRVASTMRTVEELGAGRLTPAEAMDAIHVISDAPPESRWRFIFAAAAG